jgi:hypothetical protein
LEGSGCSWKVELDARAAMAAGGSVLARGEAMAPFIGCVLACDDRMTAKVPPWYGGVSAGARMSGARVGPTVRPVRGARTAR